MKKVLSIALIIFVAAGAAVLVDTVAGAASVDLVTSASITGNEASFKKALGEDGSWLVAATRDLFYKTELVIEGTFENRGEVARELALYASDEDHNLTERYAVVAPQFTVKSPQTAFQGGYFIGDVYVKANGFSVNDATVVGNVYFEKQEYKDSFSTAAGGQVTGVTEVQTDDVDLVTSASITGDEASFAKALGEDGSWLVAATKDLFYNSELVIEGTFENRGEVARELALYASDEDHNLTERYTIVAPQFTVKSPQTAFQGGYFIGNVYVKANGFSVNDATVVGNVYFEKQEYKDSFSTAAGGQVTGVTEVK